MTPTDLCQLIEAFLDQKKAENIVRLHLSQQSLLADYFLVASGQSERHLLALGEALYQLLKKESIPSSFKPSGQNSWVIVDVGAVMVHLFLPETRALYDLEELWQLSSQAA